MNDSRHLSRRGFLGQGALVLGGGLAAFTGLGPVGRLASALAAPKTFTPDTNRHFVFCYFSGGWDVLMALDPRDPAKFTNDKKGATQIQPGYEMLQANSQELVETPSITFGPYIGDLAQHAERMAVVRGMSMDTVAHTTGLRRFLTGKPPSGIMARGSSSSTWLASVLGKEHAIPSLSVRLESFNVDQPAYASALRVNSVDDLLRTLRRAEPVMPETQEEQIDMLLGQFAGCASSQPSAFLQSAEAARMNARAMVAGGLDGLFDFQAKTWEMEKLRDHYKIPSGANGMDTPEARVAMAATALRSGMSRVVSVQVVGGLDTHGKEWAGNQGPRQRLGFNAIARMVEDLQSREYEGTGSSWLDHTTIIGFSEFSRTPLLNMNEGRDHHLTNSCFIVGAGIKGGTVIGASSDVGMMPTATSLTTGKPDPGGEVLHPEHVIQTFYSQVGIGAEADMRVDPIWALIP